MQRANHDESDGEGQWTWGHVYYHPYLCAIFIAMESNLGFSKGKLTSPSLDICSARISEWCIVMLRKCLEIGSNKIKKRYDEPLQNSCDWRSLLNIRHALILKHFRMCQKFIVSFAKFLNRVKGLENLVERYAHFDWLNQRWLRWEKTRRKTKWALRDERWETLGNTLHISNVWRAIYALHLYANEQ